MNAAAREPDPSHLDVLDGLRALAILLVLARHGLRPFWPDLTAPFLKIGAIDLGDILLNGWCGVDLFFVLSGFLITRQLLPRAGGLAMDWRGAARRFYKRRFFRIAPAYYLVMTLGCLGLLAPYPISGLAHPWRSYLYHLAFLEDYLPADILPAFWTLAVEAKFYLLAPGLVYLLTRAGPRARVAMLAGLIGLSVVVKAIAAAHLPPIIVYTDYVVRLRKPFHLSADGLIDGVIVALLWHDATCRAALRRPAIANLLFFGGVAGLIGLMATRPALDRGVTHFDAILLAPCLSACFAAMMLGLLGGAAGTWIFSRRPLRGLAIISYGIYLIHLPLVFVAWRGTRTLLPSGMPAALQWAVFCAPFLALCIALATPLYIFVEKPFIDWSKRDRRLPTVPD